MSELNEVREEVRALRVAVALHALAQITLALNHGQVGGSEDFLKGIQADLEALTS